MYSSNSSKSIIIKSLNINRTAKIVYEYLFRKYRGGRKKGKVKEEDEFFPTSARETFKVANGVEKRLAKQKFKGSIPSEIFYFEKE